MKTSLLLMLLVAGNFYAQSQTKGTNAVGFGISSQTSNHESENGKYEQKSQSYALSYGHFYKDNVRIGLSASYSEGTSSHSSTNSGSTKGYGGSLNYQKYYPLLKKFYAFAGANTGYFYSENTNVFNDSKSISKLNSVNLGGSGGAAYFLSKRFLLEVQLLTASIGYAKHKSDDGYSNGTSTSFNLSSSGSFQNMGFSVYLLF